MTKAELLHRFRWVFLVLPEASAAGFRLFLFVAERMPSVMGTVPRSWWPTVPFLALPGWCLLTFVCSSRTGWSVADDGGFRGARGIFFVVLIAPVICGMHAIACVVLFGLFPPFL